MLLSVFWTWAKTVPTHDDNVKRLFGRLKRLHRLEAVHRRVVAEVAPSCKGTEKLWCGGSCQSRWAGTSEEHKSTRIFTRRLISLSSTKSNLGFCLSMLPGLSAFVDAEGSTAISGGMAIGAK